MSTGHDIETLDNGILRVAIRGVWTKEEVDRFFEELLPILPPIRRRHGRVVTIIAVDAVQSPLVALHVRQRARAIKRAGDRNAVLVASVLSKLQIRRLGGTIDFGLFTDRATAEAWLIAR